MCRGGSGEDRIRLSGTFRPRFWLFWGNFVVLGFDKDAKRKIK